MVQHNISTVTYYINATLFNEIIAGIFFLIKSFSETVEYVWSSTGLNYLVTRLGNFYIVIVNFKGTKFHECAMSVNRII